MNIHLQRIPEYIPSDSISDPTPAPTPASTSNSTLVSSHDPLLEPPPDPPSRLSIVSRSPAERFRDVFPPGTTSTSLKGQPYTFTPQHLLNVIADNPVSRHAKDTVVTSAWYGKQTKSARHEYIVVVIEDLDIPGLKNCMSIDRNGGTAAPGGVSTVTTVSSSTKASDTFRVAYDGDLRKFLVESQLTPHQILEKLHFHQPLPLHTLVTLVQHISEQYDSYNPADTNCYWFTGLIWDCMRKMRPEARYEPHLPGKRGRIAFVRNVTSSAQVRRVVREVQAKLGSISPSSNNPPSEGEENI